MLVDTDVHTVVLTASHTQRSHHYERGGSLSYAMQPYSWLCVHRVCVLLVTQGEPLSHYAPISHSHTPIKTRRHGHTDGSTSASQPHNSLMGML